MCRLPATQAESKGLWPEIQDSVSGNQLSRHHCLDLARHLDACDRLCDKASQEIAENVLFVCYLDSKRYFIFSFKKCDDGRCCNQKRWIWSQMGKMQMLFREV